MGADFIRRTLDIFLSLAVLVFLIPIFVLIALAVKIDSAGPVFYQGWRIGKGGTPFRLYKFRTMVDDAESRGPRITLAGDSRNTRVGRFLRNTKLDEWPQLLNVLRGEMSLVGPRPETPRYVTLYTPEQRRVLSVRPGITSWASLHYRNESASLLGPEWEKIYVEKILPHKLAIELEYLSRRSLWTDIDMIFRTIWAIVVR
jgi:lipopolysaccharide/colanic/teichoic acid biosynthesis glycosyltransferase